MKCTTQQLDKTFMEILEAYKDATDETVENAITVVGKECVTALKNANPSGSGRYRSWKEYNSTWDVTKTKRDIREHKTATVHNTKHYQLTHLLEKGHALHQGGRARAFPHIAPVAEKAETWLFEKIKNGV